MLSKIIEEWIKTRHLNFFDQFSIIKPFHFGFQKGISTVFINITERIYETPNNISSAVDIFVDFSKAFDTVNRTILINKLIKYSIMGVPLKVLSSYVSDRKHADRIGNILSSFTKTTLGAPLGSVLAPFYL